MNEYEYSDSRDTWKVQAPPAYPHWFQDELIKLAGLNRHGKPNLRLVWGGNCLNEKSEEGALKYPAGFVTDLVGYEWRLNGETGFVESLNDAPPDAFVMPAMRSEPLGMLRWVVEKWVSPEELEANKRFQTRYLPGEITPVLRKFPREGVYDCYFILENNEGGFRHVDERVLEALKWKWRYDRKPYHERLADETAIEDKERERIEKEEAELWRAFHNFDLRLDKEEKERRAEFWAKHDYSLDAPLA